MTLYFSRVGFNSKKNEALVYVLAFSYVGRTAATGDYLRFHLGPDKTWTVAGRVRYIHLDDDVFVRLHNSEVGSAVQADALTRHVMGVPHICPPLEDVGSGANAQITPAVRPTIAELR